MWACQLKVGNLRVRRIKEEFASLSADILMSRRGRLISLGAHAFSSVLFSKAFADSHLPMIPFSSCVLYTWYSLLDLFDLDNEHTITPEFTSAAKHDP